MILISLLLYRSLSLSLLTNKLFMYMHLTKIANMHLYVSITNIFQKKMLKNKVITITLKLFCFNKLFYYPVAYIRVERIAAMRKKHGNTFYESCSALSYTNFQRKFFNKIWYLNSNIHSPSSPKDINKLCAFETWPQIMNNMNNILSRYQVIFGSITPRFSSTDKRSFPYNERGEWEKEKII